LFKKNAKHNNLISTNIFQHENRIHQRPWSIKYALAILLITVIYGLTYTITKDGLNFPTLFSMAVFSVLLFGIFKGKILARNIFLIISLPTLLFSAVGSVAMLPNIMSDIYIIKEIIYFSIIIPIPYVLLFVKPSQEWFLAMKDTDVKTETNIMSWNFQLTLIILSIAISIGIMLLDISFDNIDELMKEKYINENFRKIAVITKLIISQFFHSLIVLLPFGMIIGYWKKDNLFILTRLITIGVALSSMLVFTSERNLVTMGSLFLIKVIITASITYFSVAFGIKIYTYFNKDKIGKQQKLYV